MRTYTAECVWDGKATLGEGPTWDHFRNQLLWVDIEQCEIHWFDPVARLDRDLPTASHVGVAVPTRAGDLLAATQRGLVRVDVDTGALKPFLNLETEIVGNRFNDGKCDPQGRLWVGSMSYNRVAGAASLYRVDGAGRVQRSVLGVTISNGLAWSADGRTMYYIDTPTRRVDAFDFDPETGAVSNRRQAVRVPDEMGKPDGMAIDNEGMLWVALWGGWGVGRWDPRGGELLAKVEVPALQVTSCCFGGEQFDQLYITSARGNLSSDQLALQPQAGGLFVARVGVAGPPASFFAG